MVISALYRAHDLPKTEFIYELKTYLENNKNFKNYLLIGDFNIDIIKLDVLGQEHLNNLLDKGFKPGFCDSTRPSMFLTSMRVHVLSIFLSKYILSKLFLSVNKIKPLANIKPFTPINYNKFNKIAVNRNWSKVLSIHHPNKAEIYFN